MKRVASGFQNRHAYPPLNPAPGQMTAQASDTATQLASGLTIETLRELALPPFPEDVDVSTCDVVARIARKGFKKSTCDTDLGRLLRFCTAHGCADALLWFLLQSDGMTFEPVESDFDPRQVRYLFACLDRLPAPVSLTFEDASEWPEKCWDAFVDALSRSRGIREIADVNRSYSEQELARLFAAIENHPVLCEIDIGTSISSTIALNDYLIRTSTLRKLAIAHHHGFDFALAPDFSAGLLFNRSLTRIELYNWHITPAMAHALAAPGKALTEVHLGDCSFAPGAVMAFASALASNDTISSLEIQNLHDAGSDLKPIYSELQSHRSLVSLQIRAGGTPFADIAFLWKMLQANLTLREFNLGSEPYPPRPNEDPHPWSLLPHVRQRLAENRELPLFADQYPMAKLAMSILPGNLPPLPRDVSANIARLLLQTDASALPSYRALHMLASHKEIKSQHKPVFPDCVDLTSHPDAQRLARSGKLALPLSANAMRSIALFCIRHQATDALNWLAAHACKGWLDLRGSQFEPGEAGWLMHWTRAAPCPIKLRLDQVALTDQDVADIAQQLAGNQALTALSLKGCAMSTTSLDLLSKALMGNTALCALLLSEDPVVPPTRPTGLPAWPAQGPSDPLPGSNPGINDLPASFEPTLPHPLPTGFPELPVPAFEPRAPGLAAWPAHLPNGLLPEIGLSTNDQMARMGAAALASMRLPPDPGVPYPFPLPLYFPALPTPHPDPQAPGLSPWPADLPNGRLPESNQAMDDLLGQMRAAAFARMPPLAWPAVSPVDLPPRALPPPEVGLLATIAFALRRNNRLHNGDETPAALLADAALMADTVEPVPK